jgi:hypothetical protein
MRISSLLAPLTDLLDDDGRFTGWGRTDGLLRQSARGRFTWVSSATPGAPTRLQIALPTGRRIP